jgi:hypothetical protein
MEGDCANGEDDDYDELVDCEDPDCVGMPPCAVSLYGIVELEDDCENGLDDDGDDAIDCADEDCAGICDGFLYAAPF